MYEEGRSQELMWLIKRSCFHFKQLEFENEAEMLYDARQVFKATL